MRIVMAAVERRKVQRTGSSSFIITIPKEWVDAIGLKSGDYVYVYMYENKLIVTPTTAEALQLPAEIRVEGDVRDEEVFRTLVSYYLSGSTNIRVTFDPSLPNVARRISELKAMARSKLPGIEVVEETSNNVTFKILLDLKELPLINAVKRLHTIVSNMLKDSIQALRTRNAELAEAVIQRDDEADRFHFMITRELAMALLDIRVMHDLGLSNSTEVLSYRIVARNLERIADHAVNIARASLLLERATPAAEGLADLGNDVHGLFEKSMDAFYKLSRQGAETVISAHKELLRRLEESLKGKITARASDAELMAFVMIYDSLRRIARYSNGIAETTLNLKAMSARSLDVK
ncbi:MAG: phosphate uptake regulator PhoU [Desulfurococcaceae archaeon]